MRHPSTRHVVTCVIVLLTFISFYTFSHFPSARTKVHDHLKSGLSLVKEKIGPAKAPAPVAGQRNCHYPGWAKLKYLIAFGDSYTQTGFNFKGDQPSHENPLGNPGYPGETSSNGPNYIDFLTTTWNQSFLQTINLGSGGAAIDEDLVEQVGDEVRSFKYQVNHEYLPTYTHTNEKLVPWTSDDTLFTIFFGINDIVNSYDKGDTDLLYDKIFDTYSNLIHELYRTGARNFMILNVPPIERSPLSTLYAAWQDKGSRHLDRAIVQKFNHRILGVAQALTLKYPDAAVFVFDTYALFDQVMDDPKAYEQTADYKDTKDYCNEYQQGTPDWYTKYPTCEFSVDQYFWKDALHPTFRVHNATAGAIAQQIGPAGCR